MIASPNMDGHKAGFIGSCFGAFVGVEVVSGLIGVDVTVA